MKVLVLFAVAYSCVLAQGNMNNELNLSAEQKAQMRTYKEEMKVCREKIDLKILGILNDEQKIKFLQMKQNKKSNRTKKKVLNIQKVNIID